MTPTISVIILAYNRKADVLESLARIFREGDLRDVIVVDNGSSDGTAEGVKECYPTVNLLRLEKNIGIEGFNYGVAEAKGEFCLLLDDDSAPAPFMLVRMMERFRREADETVALACKVIEVDGTDATRDWPEEMLTFWGCGVVVRKKAFEEAGGYRDDFFLYRNELELALRWRLNGLKVKYCPDLIVEHRSASSNRTNRRAFRYNYRNDIFVFWNYFPLPTALNYLAKIFLMTFVKSLLRYSPADFIFIWKTFLSKWLWERRKIAGFESEEWKRFVDDPFWREMNLLQPKLTDIPRRLLRGKIVY